MKDIGQVMAASLKRLRASKGWTQKDLGAASGMSTEQIKKLETGTSWISAGGVSQLARALGVPEGEIFRDPDEIPRPTPQEAMSVLAEVIGGDWKPKRIQPEAPPAK